jgi:hypothetical protein
MYRRGNFYSATFPSPLMQFHCMPFGMIFQLVQFSLNEEKMTVLRENNDSGQSSAIVIINVNKNVHFKAKQKKQCFMRDEGCII